MGQSAFAAETLDDLTRMAVEEIRRRGVEVKATRGANKEIAGIMLELTNPRARLSNTETRGKLFSCLGELFWYLSGSDHADFICYYIPAYGKESIDGLLKGAYGPRLFDCAGVSQFETVAERLSKTPNTRRAVVQLFQASDLRDAIPDMPCTCTLQFLRRQEKLHLVVNMRSNDVIRGLTHDVFCFTMLQELLARQLGIELGTYKHVVGSLHLYRDDEPLAKRFLDEGWQSRKSAMPAMPPGDPWAAVEEVRRFEAVVRTDPRPGLRPPDGLEPFWKDIAKLLAIFRAKKDARKAEARELANAITSPCYRRFLERYT